jgi:hypothetical protein
VSTTSWIPPFHHKASRGPRACSELATRPPDQGDLNGDSGEINGRRTAASPGACFESVSSVRAVSAAFAPSSSSSPTLFIPPTPHQTTASPTYPSSFRRRTHYDIRKLLNSSWCGWLTCREERHRAGAKIVTTGTNSLNPTVDFIAGTTSGACQHASGCRSCQTAHNK